MFNRFFRMVTIETVTVAKVLFSSFGKTLFSHKRAQSLLVIRSARKSYSRTKFFKVTVSEQLHGSQSPIKILSL